MPGLLFDNKLSGYREEKILIQLDIEAQNLSIKKNQLLLTNLIFSLAFIIHQRIFCFLKNFGSSQS
ncbi:MAG: hypothetical protein C0425_01765 [Chlorobiaceae bacterium]|nr:hypothetical protein [Chlorobiaceae bacterium]MBA4309045.1 hypothetical protein [Chlorobiaceae bacterium]